MDAITALRNVAEIQAARTAPGGYSSTRRSRLYDERVEHYVNRGAAPGQAARLATEDIAAQG